MRRRHVFYLTFSLILLCGTVSVLRNHFSVVCLFGSYSHSQQFDYVVQEHLGHGSRPGSRLLYATWFLDGQPGVVMEYSLNRSGKGFTDRAVYANGMQLARPIQLQTTDLKAMEATLRSLPPSSLHPPLNRLLIVSFKQGRVWVTRLYDRKHLPSQVMRVYALGSASVDTLSDSA